MSQVHHNNCHKESRVLKKNLIFVTYYLKTFSRNRINDLKNKVMLYSGSLCREIIERQFVQGGR